MNADLLTKLTQPFTPEQLRTRPGANGKPLDYLETHSIITRLNDSLAGDWSFEVLEHWLLDREVVVRAKLTIHGEQSLTKTIFGSHPIKRYERTNEVISLGDDLKSAASDALKKAATLLGVGLELYERKRNATVVSKPSNDTSGRGHNGYSGNGPNHASIKPNRENGNGHAANHSTNGDATSSSRSPEEPLSVKQMRWIYQLAKKHSLSVGDLNARVQRDLGRASVDELTKQQASSLIDSMRVQ